MRRQHLTDPFTHQRVASGPPEMPRLPAIKSEVRKTYPMARPHYSPQLSMPLSFAKTPIHERTTIRSGKEAVGNRPTDRLLALCLAGMIVALAGGCRFAANGQNALGSQLYEQGQYTGRSSNFRKR